MHSTGVTERELIGTILLVKNRVISLTAMTVETFLVTKSVILAHVCVISFGYLICGAVSNFVEHSESSKERIG